MRFNRPYRSDGCREIGQIFVVVIEAYVAVGIEETIPPAVARCIFALEELEIHFLQIQNETVIILSTCRRKIIKNVTEWYANEMAMIYYRDEPKQTLRV